MRLCPSCGEIVSCPTPRSSVSGARRRLSMRIVTGLFLICLAMLLAVGGLVLVQRLMPARRRLRHNDVASFIYAVLGVAYAVLLGLMVIAVWEEWNAANAAVDQEASELAEVFWLAHSLPQPEGRHLQELAHSYARVVVNIGGVEVVGFTYLFGLESTTVHVLMVASLTLIIALVLFTVAALDYPFKGDIHIDPNAFEQVLGRFESSKLSDL